MMNQSQISVKEIMRNVHTISSEGTFRDALKELITQKSNSLVVIDAQGLFVGMINARVLIERAVPAYISNDEIAAHYASEDIFREAVEKVADMPLTDFMDADVETIKENESLMKVAVIATKNQQIRIPVLDDEKKPIGLLTRTELKQVIGSFLEIENCFDLG